MAKRAYDDSQPLEVLLQAVETERGAIQICTTAIQAAHNDDLCKEWQEYLEETRIHERVLLTAFAEPGLDSEMRSPGREIVAHQGKALVHAIRMAIKNTTPAVAGWTREQWIRALGFAAVLPPPEEIWNVETASGASRAEQAREQVL
jgi:hypothetical protein